MKREDLSPSLFPMPTMVATNAVVGKHSFAKNLKILFIPPPANLQRSFWSMSQRLYQKSASGE
jgi:hypothetical protein